MTRLVSQLLLAVLLASTVAQAEGAKPAPNPLARAHFQDGLASAQRGELERALNEFRSAYRIQPHFSVLYNIGQAEATLGHPIEAIDAFERYLKDGGQQVRADRQQTVRELIATNKKLIGQLRIVAAAPDRTRIWLDGTELGPDRLAAPIALKTGEHTVLYVTGLGNPTTQRVTITSTKTEEVRIDAPAEGAQEPGQLTISCAVPGVTVDISGGPRLMTPFKGPVVVPAGQVTVRFTRAGYRQVERELRMAPRGTVSVDCNQQTLTQLSPEVRAGLRVLTTPAGAEILVNGQPFVGAPLPAGPHHLRVERSGFVPLTTTVKLTAGRTLAFDATLRPTAAEVDRREQARSRRHKLGYVIGATSAALLLTSGGLYLWNTQRFEKFEQDKATATPSRNLAFATSIQRIDDLSLGLLIGGVIGGGVSAWTFYSDEHE